MCITVTVGMCFTVVTAHALRLAIAIITTSSLVIVIV